MYFFPLTDLSALSSGSSRRFVALSNASQILVTRHRDAVGINEVRVQQALHQHETSLQRVEK